MPTSKRWQATYWYQGARHRAPATFMTKSDATAWLASVETDIRRGIWTDASAGRTKVAELAERWLASNPRKRPRSVERDRMTFDLHVLPTLGARAVGTVTKADVQALVDAWQVAPGTVHRMYATVRALFNYAVAADMIGRSPCRDIRLPQRALAERPVLEAEQLERLADELGPDHAVMMWIGVVLGLRWSEAAGLRIRDLDLLAGIVSVRVQLGRDGVLVEPKSAASQRRLAAPVWLIDDLAAQLARAGVTGADREALVFTTPRGLPLQYHHWRTRVWVPATQRAGLPGLRFHDLRSMAATALVASGVDVKTAQTRLGHSTPALTLQTYARATQAGDRAAADAVGNFFRSRQNRARQPGSEDEKSV
jgi:integrase